VHGYAVLTMTTACPDSPDETEAFSLYIDPSGVVQDVSSGGPLRLAGATVTLLKDDGTGAFTPVTNGSTVLSPANRTNPDVTDAAGHFGWDVSAGRYKVRAEKTGCTSAADRSVAYAESAALDEPPEVTDLDLRLDCSTPPGPVGSAPAPASPAATATPKAARQDLTLTVNTPVILAGRDATLTSTGSPGQAYELQGYTRPSTTYTTGRSGTFDETGTATFTLSLGRNTRCFLQYATDSAHGASPSTFVDVRTVLSITATRTGPQNYVFIGRNLPRVAGQLITLYRVDDAGHEFRTATLRTDDSGSYRIVRAFGGRGTFRFLVRTSKIMENVAGASNSIAVTIR
jgi:hypothetical protein